ncbi:ribosomal L28 family-domain-containing protein [Scheffersomyces xylosifermentans]|uniref:ribosomal L28 family-domain-containing protein n=1 Tax=Scheffersomyces xylosifermentans TaxID=1304137 RepID=UPI00315D2D75
MMNMLGRSWFSQISSGTILKSPLVNPGATIIRSFSSSVPAQARNKNDKFYKILKYVKPIDTTVYEAGQELPAGVKIPITRPQFPQYAYETMFFKRQNRGLFGGVQRKRSKNCSESGNKSLRVHLPNIQKTKLWSETMNKSISIKASTKVLKTITKEGGLDNYLTKDKPARVKTLGLKGWQLKYQVLKQQELNQLPKVTDAEGAERQVLYIHEDGKRFVVGKNKLLKELYPFVRRDSYTEISPTEFGRTHNFLSIGEVVKKLEQYPFDFSKVTI